MRTDERLVFPLPEELQRFMHGAKRVGRFVESASGEILAVGADRERADAAEVDLLSSLVSVQRLGVEGAH